MVSELPFDILVITDSAACAQVGKTVIEAVRKILESPLSDRVAILVREKSAPRLQVAQQVQALQPMVQAAGAQLLIHTDIDLALDFGLNGVHLASRAALEPVRSQLRPGMLLGISRHSQDPLDSADIGLADYATISPIYRPISKPQTTRVPLGRLGLETCVKRSVRPLVALGGIQPGRGAVVMAAGAAAIALSGAILQTINPAQMLQALRSEMDAARPSRYTP